MKDSVNKSIPCQASVFLHLTWVFCHVFLLPVLRGSSHDLKSSLSVLGHFTFAARDSAIPRWREKNHLQSQLSPAAHLADSISPVFQVTEGKPDDATSLETVHEFISEWFLTTQQPSSETQVGSGRMVVGVSLHSFGICYCWCGKQTQPTSNACFQRKHSLLLYLVFWNVRK